MRVLVVVNSYNQADVLRKTLWSYVCQSFRDYSIVVADDGSSDNTQDVLQWVSENTWLDIDHVWQPDEGFQRTVILNKAVAKKRGDYLIFVDADCIAHRHFVKNHLRLAKRGAFVAGRTVRLGRRLSERITEWDVKKGVAQKVTFDKVLDGIVGDTRKLEFGIYCPYRFMWPLVQFVKRKKDIWGGNFSCWAEDFVAVNGFNEDIVGWGKEDLDLYFRFLNYGLKAISGSNIVINYHLWHGEERRKREIFERNTKIAWGFRESGGYRCKNGIDKYLEAVEDSYENPGNEQGSQ